MHFNFPNNHIHDTHGRLTQLCLCLRLLMLLLSFSTQTEKGSALHEAALFGKTDVVQKLLSAGQSSVPRKPRLNHPLLLAKTST